MPKRQEVENKCETSFKCHFPSSQAADIRPMLAYGDDYDFFGEPTPVLRGL